MVDAHDGQSGDDELAPRHVLEALAVPELPYDFADRVMGSLQAAPITALPPRRSALPWVIAVCSTALAIAATLLVAWSGRERPRVPVPAEPPLVIAAPTPIAPVPAPVVVTPPAPLLGHLVLTVDPRDAIVRVDGQSIAGPSPFIATNLAVGRHEIAVERDGYEGWSRTIDVPAGELDLPIALPTIAAAIEEPPTTTASARPRSRGSSPGLKDPFHGAGATVDPLASGEGSPDLMDPFHVAKGTGTLRIGTKPGTGPAQVSVDGKLVGMTPIASLKVSAGKHRIKWKWADGREVNMTVTVEVDEVELVRGG